MHAVISGSFSELDKIRKIKEVLENLGWFVYPTEEHLAHSPMVQHHENNRQLDEEELMVCVYRMKEYFEKIDKCNLLYILNEKNGKEHYGVGAMIELGYAIAHYKRIVFNRKPTDENIKALMVFMMKPEYYDNITDLEF